MFWRKKMKTDAVIKKEGFQALKEKLSPVEFGQFIVLINREKFDYTKWRKDIFEELPLDKLANQANQYSKNMN
jgi:hypothetical protein